MSETGDVQDLEVISGNELLVASALKAVKQWKYRPFLLDGKPVKFESRVTVSYSLSFSL